MRAGCRIAWNGLTVDGVQALALLTGGKILEDFSVVVSDAVIVAILGYT